MHTIRLPLRASALLITGLIPGTALAHPGHDAAQGLLAGLAHPLLGLDHLATALILGVWTAQRGGQLRFGLPAIFCVALLAGVLAAGVLPVHADAVEQLIAVSLFALGVLVSFAWRLPAAASMLLAAAFAACHGLAHGSELPAGASLATYGLGLAATTLAVALCARTAAPAVLRIDGRPLRWLGAAAACCGLVLL